MLFMVVVQDSVLQLYDNSGRIAILSSTFDSLLKNSLQQNCVMALPRPSGRGRGRRENFGL
jgi:hypothetical protein